MNSKILVLTHQTKYRFKECFDKNDAPKDINLVDWQFFLNGHQNYVDIAVDEQIDKTAGIYATFTTEFVFTSKNMSDFSPDAVSLTVV